MAPSHPHFVFAPSQFCLPLLLEKLSSDIQSAKVDSLLTLVHVTNSVHISSNQHPAVCSPSLLVATSTLQCVAPPSLNTHPSYPYHISHTFTTSLHMLTHPYVPSPHSHTYPHTHTLTHTLTTLPPHPHTYPHRQLGLRHMGQKDWGCLWKQFGLLSRRR